MLKPVLLFLVCAVSGVPAFSQSYWQQQVNHLIDVTLVDSTHELNGFEKIEYYNNSPDTLDFIWFHIWPNAFKNDRTAFSEQRLQNNKTDFYFSKKEERGYINRLDFKVDGLSAELEDHPQHIDILKLILPAPLLPGKMVNISTPFHVQLPRNFSRGGHVGDSYQVTQWYPKPAVYDKNGWHPIPYLDLGEFYSEFGNYDVRITVAANYVVAATGELQDESERAWLNTRREFNWVPLVTKKLVKTKSRRYQKKIVQDYPASSGEMKTIQFKQSRIHDFAWFADKRFRVKADSMVVADGRTVKLFSYFLPASAAQWDNSISDIREAVRTRSELVGPYPYGSVSVVEAKMGVDGGMEYPMITSISPVSDKGTLTSVIGHEVGHNWFYGILASNERKHAWMDEGMNSYYDDRTRSQTAGKGLDDLQDLLLEGLYSIHKDQPIDIRSEEYSPLNYGVISYTKTAQWMKNLELQLGRPVFDSMMKGYFEKWKFKHPYPEDFKSVADSIGKQNLDSWYSLKDRTGALETGKSKKIRPALFYGQDYKKFHYINVMPAIGVNKYDKFMIGAAIHNYQVVMPKFRFLAIPLYATGSKQFNYLARASYGWYPGGLLYRAEIGLAAARFSTDEFTPAGKEKIILGFRKLAPFARITFKESHAGSQKQKYIQFRTYFFNEDNLLFRTQITGTDTMDIVEKVKSSRYLNQLKFVVENDRALYPYSGELQVEQASQFIRAAFTGSYSLNYPGEVEGGLKARFFAGKFLYTGSKTFSKQFETDRYHLNLTGANGYEDYTYSTYFAGRNEFDGGLSRQIMQRDGAFKVRTDLLSSKIGKTDDWLSSLNLVADIPIKSNALHAKSPLKIFVDIGTYAEGWKKDAPTARFLFDAGLQLSILNETVNVYMPIIYSKEFSDYFLSTLGSKSVFKTISFSIDVQNFKPRRLIPQLIF
ncbi:MAG: M1 family metallopeptidase [Gemmatimonadaceae bacterium]|nr:M1 family metallopeptidase [Chitinophagaceae bacterium]